ncbi:hypothetical protein ROA7450_00768 [Roseovarius albus]|uniref:Uncharacterized protein n=1 Tax=Roseovarius albus TaxID=1247867 RepID=A0A1X6YHX8_9RHOB|nr:hypothetical protein ROA7450_00768 [Roseovarius albus]
MFYPTLRDILLGARFLHSPHISELAEALCDDQHSEECRNVQAECEDEDSNE